MSDFDDHRRNRFDSPGNRRNFLNVIAILMILLSIAGYVIYMLR